MKGLLYKNIIQSKLFLIISIFLPPVMLALLIVFSSDFEKGFSMTTIKESFYEFSNSGLIVRFSLYSICFFISVIVPNAMISADENKKWSHFITSTPDGIKKQVYSKYLIIFISLCVNFLSITLTDMAHCSITSIAIETEIPALTGIFTFIFYVILLYLAIDIPFSVRFGVKKGAQVKCIMLAVLLFATVVYLLFGPLPKNSDIILDAVYGTIEKLINNQLSDKMMLVMGIIPVISAIAYVTSYFISCKLFMKGVEEYDK